MDLSVAPQFSQSDSLLDSTIIVAVAVLASACLLLWKTRHRLPELGLGALWWLICLLPTLVVPLNVLVNDHRPYLAMGGLAIGMGSAARWRFPRWPVHLKGTLAIVLIALCWQRAFDWKTEISLWENAVREGPAVAAAHHNRAFAYHQNGNLKGAQVHYEQAVELQPDYTRPLTNLGALYRDAGRLDQAEVVLLQAMRSDPGAAEPLNNLGLVYAAQGRPEQAIRTSQAALQSDPNIAEIWYNMGLAQRDAGFTEDAVQSLHRALQLDPGIRQRLGSP